MVDFIKPQKLHPGDIITVLSPSWGGPSLYLHVYENGLKVLREKFNLRIKEYPS